jgi:hypothetical protein
VRALGEIYPELERNRKTAKTNSETWLHSNFFEKKPLLSYKLEAISRIATAPYDFG